jgi:malonyl-CoA O-methyltransferase
MIHKASVQKAFSLHASAYEQETALQRGIADRLCQKLGSSFAPASILDIGCGTGTVAGRLGALFPHATITGIDLAPGMIAEAQRRWPGHTFQVADAESLPFPDQTFECVVSSTAYQWIPDLGKAVKEARRVLTGDGIFLFSMFGGKTLRELQTAYRTAFSHRYPSLPVPLQPFLPLSALWPMLEGFQVVSLEKEYQMTTVPDLKTLLKSLQQMGAQNAHPNRPRGLGQRRLIMETEIGYREQFQNAEGTLPVTWEIFYVKAFRTPHPN